MTAETTTAGRGPVQVTGEVFSVKQAGDYLHLTIVAGGIAERARPGTFVTVAVGGDVSAALLPRPFWIYRAKPTGAYGGTVEIVCAARGKGSTWLARRRAHEPVRMVGPLGRGFSLPREPVTCALVGEGYASAVMFTLAERLRERECGVHMVLGGHGEGSLFGALEARRAARSVTVVTRDGSVGIKGGVADVLPQLMERTGVEVAYACGPPGTLAQTARICGTGGVWCQTALEQPMACGFGACGGCVVPVHAGEGAVRMARACVDGPVFPGDRVAWDRLGAADGGES